MVIFMHIDYNNSCTRVFRMCLMVIDMCIDKTLGILGQFIPISSDNPTPLRARPSRNTLPAQVIK